MRVLMKARMCTQKANELARNGKLGSTIQTILEELGPEAAYFTDDNGQRTAFLFVNITDNSEIPKLAEPWFLALDAEIELHPVMNVQDFGRAESFIDRAARQYPAK